MYAMYAKFNFFSEFFFFKSCLTSIVTVGYLTFLIFRSFHLPGQRLFDFFMFFYSSFFIFLIYLGVTFLSLGLSKRMKLLCNWSLKVVVPNDPVFKTPFTYKVIALWIGNACYRYHKFLKVELLTIVLSSHRFSFFNDLFLF